MAIFETVIVWRLLKTIGTPWKEQKAYKLGIIDEKGKTLKKTKDLETSAEKKAYTALDILAFNIKRLFAKFGLKSKIGSLFVTWKLLLQEDTGEDIPDDTNLEKMIDELCEALSTSRKAYSKLDKTIMSTLIAIGQAVDDDVEDVLIAIDNVPGQSEQRKRDLLKNLRLLLQEESMTNSVGGEPGTVSGINDGTNTKILGFNDVVIRKKIKKKM